MKLHYFLDIKKPNSHYFDVRIELSDLHQDEIMFTMPAWVPGSYSIEDFARYVRNFTVESPKGALKFTKVDKSTWKVFTQSASLVTLTYSVFADNLSVHTSQLNSTHAYINGTSVFMYVETFKELPIEVDISPPQGWRISTGLKSIGANKFLAENYDNLVDCPIEIGTHKSLYFSVLGKEHEIVLCGHGNEDENKLIEDVKKIVEEFSKLFHGLPYERYVFIYHLVDSETTSEGGLEHVNSTSINIDRFKFGTFEKYRAFLSVTSHEFFHLWNVKRIRPAELGPFNYKQENYTTMLWFAEGFTDFMGNLYILRAKLTEEKDYYKHISEKIRIYDLLPGSLACSASQSSFNSWIKLYKPSPNNVNDYISYYLLGELIAVAMNVKILEATGGKKSLDDLFQYLMDKFMKDGRGYTEKDLIKGLHEVSEVNFSPFFMRHVDGEEKIDFDEILKALGLKLRKSYIKTNGHEISVKPYLGILLKSTNLKVVDSVLQDSPAYSAGLSAGDEVVAINGFKFDDKFLKNLQESNSKIKTDNLLDFRPEERIRITFFRNGLLNTVETVLKQSPFELYEIVEMEDTPQSAIALRSKFLFG